MTHKSLKGENGIKKVIEGGGESDGWCLVLRKIEGFIQWRKCLEK
jgi:hypothetical protein